MFIQSASFTLLLAMIFCGCRVMQINTKLPNSTFAWNMMDSANKRAALLQSGQVPAPFGRYTENINGALLELVRIPTGAFLMGNDRSPNPEEKPAHQVNVRSVFMGRYEITRQQWNIVATLPQINRPLSRQYLGPVQAGGAYGEMTPADTLSWEQAVEFCDRLSRYTGKNYRLPSEAEWEYACRAGTQTEYSFGDQFNPALANMEFVANYLLDAGKIGYANAWGFFEMHGNVTEWCLDNEHPNYVGAPTNGSAWLQGGDNRSKVLRGGRYRNRPETGRSSSRSFNFRNMIVTGYGFRVVADISPTIGNNQLSVVSAASYTGARVTANSIAALFGSNLSGATQSATGLPLPVTLSNASVTLRDSRGNEHLAPLFFASPGQINFLAPPNLPLGPATVYAVNNGDIHASGALEIVNVSPGLFTADASGAGLAAALVLRVRSDGTQVYEPIARFDPALNRFTAIPVDLSNPAEQAFLLLFGTGFRQRSSLSDVIARVGGLPAEVLFAGEQGGFVGLDQCNLRLPQALAGRGEVEVALTVEGKAANSVKLVIK